MKPGPALLLLISLVLMFVAGSRAQVTPTAAQKAQQLRAELHDVEAQEAELQLHVKQLDYDLQPENIRLYFATTGSLRPADLYEQRRQQLQHEKDRALAQLEQVGERRRQLEMAIPNADAEAYQQSIQNPDTSHVGHALRAKYLDKRVLVAALALVIVAGGAALIAIMRR